MPTVKNVAFVIRLLIFTFAFRNAFTWTIDLDEVRKIYFENSVKRGSYDEHRYVNDAQEYYSNYEGDGLHNAKDYNDAYKHLQYADEYNYQSYMEKKVHDVIRNGSIYLEGLRRSIEDYTQRIENCTERNMTLNQNSTSSNLAVPRQNASEPSSFSTPPISLSNMTSFLSNATRSNVLSCEEVTQRSEYVRRLAELALWVTRELQERNYVKKYEYKENDSYEEKALLLRLAWFLDQLAHLTGYEANPADYVSNTTAVPTSPPPSPTQPSLLDAPESVKTAMMECLELNSSEPATVRCAYPLLLPPMVAALFNISDNTSLPTLPSNTSISEGNNASSSIPASPQNNITNISSSNVTSDMNLSNTLPTNMPEISSAPSNEGSIDSVSQPSSILQLLIPFKNDKTQILPPKTLTATKIIRKKRSVEDDPLLKFLKYYTKHKSWINSNLNVRNYDIETQNSDQVISNVDSKIQKRSVNYKKWRIPDNPMQDISDYVKRKPGTRYINDEKQADEIKNGLEKIHNSTGLTSKKYIRNFEKRFKRIQKRSTYYKKNVLPRISEDPMQDISYYVKNKPGTNNRPNLLQAVQIRAGLEQVFQTGNIEVVRRFGSNYNPAVPIHLADGLARSMADV